MKYYLIFFLTASLNKNLVFAQSFRSIRVKAGEDVALAYSPQGFYRFPQFGKAILYYKAGGKNSGAQFNYNVLSGNLQFISPNGDTLELAGPENIDSVVFEGTVLLYNDGFMEIVAAADSLLLLKRTNIKTQTENIGAYGSPNTTASIVNMKSYSNGVGVYSLVLNQDVLVAENISWFFINQNKTLVKANKSNLLKLLAAGKQSKTEAWLRQNKTGFEKEADLKKLMAAIPGL
jgi:hypothetical protein